MTVSPCDQTKRFALAYRGFGGRSLLALLCYYARRIWRGFFLPPSIYEAHTNKD